MATKDAKDKPADKPADKPVAHEKADVKAEPPKPTATSINAPTPTAKPPVSAKPLAPVAPVAHATAAPAPAPAKLKLATLTDMPVYQSNKRVWALKIERVVNATVDAPARIEFTDPKFDSIEISKGYLDEWHPHSGGYYVLEGNGHQSFLPGWHFESEYKEAK